MRGSKSSNALHGVAAVVGGDQAALSSSSNNEATSSSTSTTMTTNNTAVEEPQHLTIVIKLGSSSIVNEDDFQPQLALLSSIVETVCNLRRKGHRVVLVSSGAIAMGLKRMEMRVKPKVLAEKQALAAIGQGRLIALWDNLFSMLGQPIAQVLLTRSDISDRSRYLNSTKTLSALLSYGVIPIVNENDTVSVSEIKFGDNDTLSAITASMVSANYLFLLTDVDCLYTDNPRRFPETAKKVRIVRDIEKIRELVSTSTMGSNLGTGGMETKIIAAELAINAGVTTVITHGKKPDNILNIVNSHVILDNSIYHNEGEDENAGVMQERERQDREYEESTPLHTVFLPEPNPLPDKRWWVLHGLKPRGRIIIDEGAYRAIARSTVNASSSSSSSTPRAGGGITTPPASSSTLSQQAQSSVPTTSSPLTPSEPASAIPSPSLLATTSSSNKPFPSLPTRSNSRNNTSSSSTNTSGNGGRLLPAGVIAVEGTFAAGQAVTVVVQRKRRRNRRDSHNTGIYSNQGNAGNPSTSANAGNSTTRGRTTSGNRSGNSSLANSLILEQAKQLGDPYDTNQSVTSTPETSRPSSPTRGSAMSGVSNIGSTSKRQEKRNRKRRDEELNGIRGSDTEHDPNDTTTDDEHDHEEVLEQIEFGRGLANYNYQEIDRIKGHKSSEIEKILGYIESEHCVESITSLKRLDL